MRKLIALAAALALAGPLEAGKGGSSGFSGGSSRPSSSGLSGGRRPSGAGLSGGSRPAASPPRGVSGLSGGSKPAAPLPGKAPAGVSKKPAAPAFNALGADAARREESRRNYEKAAAPAPTYKTPKGEARPLPPKDPEVEYLRGRLDGERWASRPRRYDDFYRPYQARPAVVYGDPYAPMWTYFLLDKGTDVAALWLFHHSTSVDAARRDAMYAQNAELRARVAALERQGVKRDPTWQPAGVDPDLAYNDGFVTAGYNPTPKEAEEHEGGGGVPAWLVVVLVILAIGIAASIIFVPRWNI